MSRVVEAYQTLDVLGTVRWRIGYAFDSVLISGTGSAMPVDHTADSVSRTQGQLVTAGLTYRFSALGD